MTTPTVASAGFFPAQKSAFDLTVPTRSTLETLNVLTGRCHGPVSAGLLANRDRSISGVFVRGDLDPHVAITLAVDEIKDHPEAPVGLAGPDIVAVVSRPRYWLLRENPDGNWHGQVASNGAGTTGAVLGVRVTFEQT